ncbi:hypothetical protein [Borrelia sp. P9F1]|nr:hypothetical protein [Borrelia sp. P9F1]WKC58552.1 hypothetical protein QYZ68_04965 [Borrelia sp. P9F1]WKC58641.1 hypothetical protein QYZ68_05415 [Borrelia sp. P9F1]
MDFILKMDTAKSELVNLLRWGEVRKELNDRIDKLDARIYSVRSDRR